MRLSEPARLPDTRLSSRPFGEQQWTGVHADSVGGESPATMIHVLPTLRAVSAAILLAWVMWLKQTAIVGSYPERWSRISASETQAECQARVRDAAAGLHANITPGGDGMQPIAGGVIFTERSAGRITAMVMVVLECWPDSVDPRK